MAIHLCSPGGTNISSSNELTYEVGKSKVSPVKFTNVWPVEVYPNNSFVDTCALLEYPEIR